jgi:hypothetical protein
MPHDTLDNFSFPGNKTVCSSCWWLPSNHFFCNIIKLYIYNWIFINYVCNIKVFDGEDLMTKCLLFTVKLLVFKYCFIFIILGGYTFPGNKTVCSSCWWLPSNHFFCNIIKLYIYCFRSKMVGHLKRLICDCLSLTEGLITWLFSTDKIHDNWIANK